MPYVADSGPTLATNRHPWTSGRIQGCPLQREIELNEISALRDFISLIRFAMPEIRSPYRTYSRGTSGFWCINGGTYNSGLLYRDPKMPRAVSGDAIYRRRRFPSDVIELCVRWYITYRLSYRDLSAMMAEHGVTLTHTTIMRWVLRYVPEYERRWARFARPVGSSWRTAETAVAVRGKHHYLYRAVDKSGKSVDSLVSPRIFGHIRRD